MKINRLLGILLYLLNRRTATAKELADHFEVSQRTIYRDMISLEEAGIPLMADQGIGGGYGLPHHFQLDRQLFRPRDLEALSAMLKGLDRAIPDPARAEALGKIQNLLPREEGAGPIVIDIMPWGSGPALKEKLNRLHRAIQACRITTFQYRDSHGNRTQRSLEPYHLIFRGSDWYLWGYCLLRNDYRMFRLSRISDLELDGSFEPRDDSAYNHLEQNLPAETPKEILLKVFPPGQERAKEEFPQEWLEEDGQDLIVHLHYGWDPWVKGYLLSWGNRLEVLGPPAIRQWVQDQLKEMTGLYH